MTPRQQQLAAAFAEALLPAGAGLAAGGAETVAAVEALLASRVVSKGLGGLLGALEPLAWVATGRRFTELDLERRAALLSTWEQRGLLGGLLYGVGGLFKTAHFDSPRYYEALGAVRAAPGKAEPARWLEQVRRGDELTADEELECDVVIAGTGAGGAVLGKELASRGLAVVFLEEGELVRRDRFGGSSWRAFREFYRWDAREVALGNAVIPILTGRLVGGSTALNGGTAKRGLPEALDEWAEALGSDELSAAGLAPYYERVERELGACPTRAPYLGRFTELLRTGAERLGWASSLVPRNAPDCDGQGLCTFGCPTDAKRSTNVSYVPWALERGALLFTRTRALRVLEERGRARGLEAEALGSGRRVRVRARATVLACGALGTPSLLLGQGLANSSGALGRHLKLHPTTMISGLFAERLAAYAAVPQAIGCDELVREGLILYAAAAPPDAGAHNFALSGRRLVDVMERYDQVGTLTLIVIDESEGRLRRLPGGRRAVTYRLSARDSTRIHRGLVAGAEWLRAAGATGLYPLSPRCPELPDGAALERYRGLAPGPRDAVLTSVHPLGTCRMSRDPRDGVVGPDHETHDVEGLWVVDASAVPATPRMNPQLTVMAMALRAAGKLEAKLEKTP